MTSDIPNQLDHRVIEALESGCRDWKVRRRVVLKYLDRGYGVPEIVARTGFYPRVIHSVQERLTGPVPVEQSS